MYHCRWKAFLRQFFRALKKADAGRKQTEPGEKILRRSAEWIEMWAKSDFFPKTKNKA